MRIVLLLGLFVVSSVAGAQQVYKWKDANGVTHYGDKPVGNNDARPADLPALQIYGLPGGRKSYRSGDAPYGGNGPHVEITQPGPDALLTPYGGKFMVGVAVAPELAAGQSFNYYLDGALLNRAPTFATSYQVTGATNGDHMISVAVVDQSGRELSRSEPVIFHLQGATAGPAPTATPPQAAAQAAPVAAPKTP